MLGTRRLHGVVDDEGRPLLELAPEDVVRCPYPGSRHGQLMNRPALDQIRRHWDFILATVRSLGGGSWPEAWRSSVRATSLALLAEPPIPGRLAALYKACVGFSQVFTHVCLHGEPTGDFLDWLDAEGWLLGTQQVCAGSRGQIGELLQAFRAPGHSDLPDPAEFLAMQGALALATYRTPLPWTGLGRALLEDAEAPWLFSLTSVPGLPPESVLRLHDSRRLRDFLADPREERLNL